MRRLCIAAFCLWTWQTSDVFAQPLVHVRAESRIEISVNRVAGGVAVEAILRDDLGAPLADRNLDVRLNARANDHAPMSARRRSNANGRVRVEFELPTGDYEIGVEFAGDDDHDRAQVARPLDLTRADVRLHIRVPNEGRFALDDANPATVEVQAESVEGGENLAVQLSDELGRPLAGSRTNASGVVEFRLRTRDLGAASAGRIVAHSTADARRAEAQTEVPILRITRTTTTLHANSESARPGDTIALQGAVKDGDGAGLPRAAVSIYEGERHLTSTLTDENGNYATTLTLEGVDDDVTLVARFDSDAPWRISSAAPPVVVRVAALAFMPFVWALLTTLVTVALLWLLARRTRKPLAAAQLENAPKAAGVERGARVSIRLDRFEVSGEVLDTHDARIGGAQLELRGPTTASTESDPHGAFRSDELPVGEYSLTVHARGYASQTVRVTIPHRGEWANVRVRLLSLRKKALDAIHPVAAEVMPRGTWGVTTAREVVKAAKSTGPMPKALPPLAEKAELAGYAAEPPTEALVNEVEEARDAALHELAARKPRPDPV